MADIHLYNAPQSTCSQRVRFALHAKGLEFEESKLDLFSGDQLKPEYLAINPNGVVPAIVENGVPVIDSAVILEYLEDTRPEISPMRPADAVGAAKMRAMMRFIDEVPTPAIRVPSYNLAFLPHFQAMTEEEFQALCDSKPLRREFLMRMGRTGFPEKDMEEAMGRLKRGIERMDGWITESGGPWVMGDRLSLADLSIMPVIVRMDDINLGHLWADRPQIATWLDNIRHRPEFKKTYYHGSLLTEKYPHLAKLREEKEGV
ncbi:glutathione S-transferase family protein [Histidinibacterium aquaticum]|uniref:Glutathione S-transferase family protein n=1 Tax=Histidinibacterium aquaticum TaxID=2613962 RepID=A0A5J5GF81_9RHOB|nr:glutathione S-transferase family protein [Histidinibacterium aquaticum]KAA9006771.1 glutathione S-transferase family protein [Histidinibacterium aquaticum]